VAQGEQDKSEAAAGSTSAGRLAAKRAAKAAAKAAKRATGPVPNEVQQGVNVARHFYENNARMVWMGLGAGLLLGVGWLLVTALLAKQGHEVTDLLQAGVTTANAPVIAEGEDVPEDLPESFSSEKARAEKALAEYKKTIAQFPDKLASAWAHLGAGQALDQLGKHGDAQKEYQLALAGDDKPPFLRMLALQGFGFSLEADKKFSDAASRFAQINALADGAYKPVGEYNRARMLVAQGKPKDAATALEALLKAEHARPAEQGERWKSVVDDAQTMLDELAVQLDDPKLRSSNAGGSGLPQNILDALRGKMAAGKGEPALNEEILKQLEQQVDKSGSAPAPGSAPKPPAAPAEDKPK
jgi:tetratricopeptide (TPR) repeat protein